MQRLELLWREPAQPLGVGQIGDRIAQLGIEDESLVDQVGIGGDKGLGRGDRCLGLFQCELEAAHGGD